MKVDLSIADNVQAVIDYDYDPPQEQILYPLENAQPGYDAEIHINNIYVGEGDILDLLRLDCVELIEDRIRRIHEG